MRRRIIEAGLLVAAAGLFGFIMEGLPAPTDSKAFFVGNFSAPWAVLAFLLGWSRRRPTEAVLVAVAGEIACVFGFYGRGLTIDPLALGLAGGTNPIVVMAISLVNLVSFAWHWLLAAIVAGTAYGLLGAWWARSRSLVPALLVALPFFIEPLAWQTYDGYLKGPGLVWICEAGVGIAVLAAMASWARRSQVSPSA